jgi:hypothetical protein
MTILTKSIASTTTTIIELFQALNDEVGDQEDYNDEDIMALISAFVAGDYAGRYCAKIPCRISPLRGEAYIQELLSQAHPQRFQEVLRMPVNTFIELASFYRSHTSLGSSRSISVEQKLAMFLFSIGRGASNRVVQEAFQHSSETISRLESP